MESSCSEVQKKGHQEAKEKKKKRGKRKRENSTKKVATEESLIKDLLSDALDIIRQKIKVEDKDVYKAYLEILEKFKAYSLFNTTLSRNRFLDAFEKCLELKEKINMPNLNIISLGGGPGTDMIGFCSALQDFKSSSIKKLNITVVDIWKRWASFHSVLEFLIREGKYGNVSQLFTSKDVFSSFMMIDLLSESQPHRYTSDLITADIVLLARVLDSFNLRKTRPTDLIKKIISGMKSGALLLVIDSVTRDHNDDEATQIYKSDLDDYLLNIKIFSLDTSKSSKAGISIIKKK